MAIDPKEAERRAAALEALRGAPTPSIDAGFSWSRHGRALVGLVAFALGLRR